MAQQTINIGTVANDGTGDPLRTAFDKCNDNFTELYASGSGDVTSAANLTNNAVVRGDGGAKGVQTSGVLIGDSDEISGYKGDINFQTGTTYELVAADTGKIIDHANANPITVTLPNDAAVGFCCTYVQADAGQITFTAEATGSLVNRQSHTKTAGENAMVTLYVRSNSGTNPVWVMGGDTAA